MVTSHSPCLGSDQRRHDARPASSAPSATATSTNGDGMPSAITTHVMIAVTSAPVAYRGPPPKIAGMRPTSTSRITPPPTALVIPSRIAGSGSSPYPMDFAVPVAAHSPIAAMSSAVTVRRHHGPSGEIRNENSEPASAQARYQGPSNAAGVP